MQVPPAVVRSVLQLNHLLQMVQRRLVAILMHIVTLFPRNFRRPGARQLICPFQTLASQSAHLVILRPNAASCARCLEGCVGDLTLVREWLATTCVGSPAPTVQPVCTVWRSVAPMSVLCPAPVPLHERDDRQLHVFGHPVHRSHLAHLYRGLILCSRCGCVAAARVHKLRHPCQPATQYGVNNLRRLQAGLPPRGVSAWPADLLALGSV